MLICFSYALKKPIKLMTGFQRNITTLKLLKYPKLNFRRLNNVEYILKNPPFTVGLFISILGYGVPAPLPVSEPVPPIASRTCGS
jgi:hypothetical protein